MPPQDCWLTNFQLSVGAKSLGFPAFPLTWNALVFNFEPSEILGLK